MLLCVLPPSRNSLALNKFLFGFAQSSCINSSLRIADLERSTYVMTEKDSAKSGPCIGASGVALRLAKYCKKQDLRGRYTTVSI